MARIVGPRLNWPPGVLLLWANDLARRFVTGSFTLNPASINATTTVDITLSDLTLYPEIKGLRAGMPVDVTPPSDLNAGLGVIAKWVATDDTLTIRLRNFTGLAVDQGAGVWSFTSFLL